MITGDLRNQIDRIWDAFCHDSWPFNGSKMERRTPIVARSWTPPCVMPPWGFSPRPRSPLGAPIAGAALDAEPTRDRLTVCLLPVSLNGLPPAANNGKAGSPVH